MLTPHPPFSYRDDPDVPGFDDAGPVAVMDATCGLCAKGASWIARNDAGAVFRIVPIQSPLGAALARHYGVDPMDPVTWLVIDAGRAFHGLDATMQAARHFNGRWRALALLNIVPRGLRDGAYRLVARNRYRFFGRVDMCAMPDPAVQARLLK